MRRFLQWINRQLMRVGYEIMQVKPRTKEGYVLYSYQDETGAFNYERYRDTQVKGNKTNSIASGCRKRTSGSSRSTSAESWVGSGSGSVSSVLFAGFDSIGAPVRKRRARRRP